jgi:hypothetical protein
VTDAEAESNSAACPITMGPLPRTEDALEAVRLGIGDCCIEVRVLRSHEFRDAASCCRRLITQKPRAPMSGPSACGAVIVRSELSSQPI